MAFGVRTNCFLASTSQKWKILQKKIDSMTTYSNEIPYSFCVFYLICRSDLDYTGYIWPKINTLISSLHSFKAG